MKLQRVQVKFYLDDDSAISSEDAFRIFNTWIRETTEEVLVDVADYSHLPAGPQTLLVGHEASYSLDNTDHRFGLLYARRQPMDGSTPEKLRLALGATLTACRRLEGEPDLGGKVKFRGEELLLVVNDRLESPNSDDTLAALKPHLDEVLGELYQGAQTELDRDPNPRQRFNLRISAEGRFDISALLQNL